MVRAKLDPGFSDPAAQPTDWAVAAAALEKAELYWLTTVRPSGQPNISPLIGLFYRDAFYFCTGTGEQKYRNLELNPQAAVTTGSNSLRSGLDLVIEGTAVKAHDEERLRRLAELYEDKYGSEWHFDVEDGLFKGGAENRAQVFEIAPTKAFAFAKDTYAQTRFTF